MRFGAPAISEQKRCSQQCASLIRMQLQVCESHEKLNVNTDQLQSSNSGVADENCVWGLLESEVRLRGARCLAYPPVIAGSPRGNVIHYTANDQPLRSAASSSTATPSRDSNSRADGGSGGDRELLLVDR